jgi:hypothetical protein
MDKFDIFEDLCESSFDECKEILYNEIDKNVLGSVVFSIICSIDYYEHENFNRNDNLNEKYNKCKILIQHGANLNKKYGHEKGGTYIIEEAIVRLLISFVKLLKPETNNDIINEAFRTSFHSGFIDLDYDNDDNINESIILRQLELMKYFLDTGHITTWNKTYILGFNIRWNEDIRIIKLLLDHGADPNVIINGLTPIGIPAIEFVIKYIKDNLKTCNLLISKGAKINIKLLEECTNKHKKEHTIKALIHIQHVIIVLNFTVLHKSKKLSPIPIPIELIRILKNNLIR